MTDLVGRLRDRKNDAPLETEYMMDEAADEIKRLRKDRDSWKVLADLANNRADEARNQLVNAAWRPIETAPKDRFILVYCPEDESRWMVKWQGGEWYGMDCEHGIRRTGQSLGDPDYVTGWFVSHWREVPAFIDEQHEAAGTRPVPSMSPEPCKPALVLAASTGEQQCKTLGVTAGETATQQEKP